jgi:4-amino-4-deoxy-L-arabinose transferase-like glycosyltransferase
MATQGDDREMGAACGPACPIAGARPEILLFLISLILLTISLDTPRFHGDHEPKVAETAARMLSSGEWIVPYYDNAIRLEKPPLAYWAVAASYAVTGRVDEFGARLPCAAMGVVAILLAYLLGRRLYGRTGGLVFGVALASAQFFMLFMRQAATDEYLAFFVFLSFYLFYLFYESGKRAPLLGFYAALALAALSKGPVALAIVPPPIILFVILTKRTRLFRNAWHIAGIAMFLVLSLAWPAAVALKMPNALSVWWSESFSRLGNAKHEHGRPFYYYLRLLPALAWPWVAFVIAGVVSFRKWCAPEKVASHLYLLLWLAWGFVFFSCIPEKKTPYLLPLAPAGALLPAGYLLYVMNRNPVGDLLRMLLAINGVFYIVAGVVVAALIPPVIPMRHAPFQLGDAAWFGAVGTLVAGVGCGTWLLVAALRRKYLSSITAICVCSFLTILLGVFVFLPYAILD